eukprot:Gb_02602 [translate_table: standard]
MPYQPHKWCFADKTDVGLMALSRVEQVEGLTPWGERSPTCIKLQVVGNIDRLVYNNKKHYQSNRVLGAEYAKCGNMEDAQKLFATMPERNEVSWNSMIAGYSQHGNGEEALKLFWEMQQIGVKVNNFASASIVRACAGVTTLEQGKHIHADIAKIRLYSDVYLGSALVDMYAKCGNIEDARLVFNEMPE